MIINRKELLETIENVLPGISKNTYKNEQSNCIIFHENKIITYNDSVAVFHPFTFDFNGAIKAVELHKVIKTLKGNEIEMSLTNDGMLIKTDTTKTTLKVMSEIELPFGEIPQVDEYFDIPKKFFDGAHVCASNCIDNKEHPLCKYMLFEDNYILATDTSRVIQYDLGEIMPRFYLDSTIVSKLLSYVPICYSIVDGWALFKNEKEIVFAIRLIDSREVFPITNRVCDKVEDSQFSMEELLDFEGFRAILPKDLLESLAICKIVSGKTEAKVTITVKDGYIYVHNVGDEGVHKARFKIGITESFSFIISPDVLKEAMKLDAVFSVNKQCGMKVENEDFKQFVSVYSE